MTVGSAPELSDSCLAGGGEMGARMRAFDWSTTSLGPVSGWPQSLKTAVSICLNSQFPMILWWGPELTVLYNDGYIPMLGVKHPGRALGRPGREVWAEVWDVIAPLLERVMSAGEANWADDLLLFINRSGYPEETYFRFSYSPIRDESGGVGGVFTPVSETTGKVIAERRLRTLQELSERAAMSKEPREALRAAANVLSKNPWDVPFAALYLLDGEGAGATLAAAAGHPAVPEIVDERWIFWKAVTDSEITAIEGAARLLESLPPGPWGDQPETLVIVPIAAPGQAKTDAFLLAGVSPRRRLDAEYKSFFSLAAGQIGAAIGNAIAFEHQRRRAEALAEIDRAKTLFFSNISHEFRTPLTLLLGPLEHVLAAAPAKGVLDPELRADVEIAHRNALRLLRLVNALLDFSRIEAGRAQANFEPLDLSRLTTDLAGAFRSAVEAAGLRFEVDCEPLPSAVMIDRDMWEKVVFNLLSNALKFTFEGEIRISLRASGGRIELVVSDTGAGIEPSQIPRIFERFHRVEGARARTFEGTGIGLSLVKELVALHGGGIRVESEPGSGSRFTVSIPEVRDEAGSAPPAVRRDALNGAWIDEISRWDGAVRAIEPSEESSQSDRPLVLLVDDNADMRDYAARLLSSRFAVAAVADGEQALAAVRARRPDLVLADVMMPRLDGFGLLAALRADPGTRDIPVILLSARAGEESRVEGMEAGADDYLIKPFSAVELMARVESHLKLAAGRARAAAELRASEEFNRSIVESSGDAICVLNRNGELVSFNAPAAAAARRNGSLSGALWANVFGGESAGAAKRAIEAAASGHPSRLEIASADGSGTKWLNTLFTPIRDESGMPARILAVSRDATEQKRTEEQLMLLVRASSTLLTANPATVVESIIRLAEEFVAADGYAVWRRDFADTWRIVSSSGLSEAYAGAQSSGGSPPLETTVVENALDDEFVRNRFEHYRKEGIRSLVLVPLRDPAEVNGTLVFYYRTPRRFSPSEVSLCTAVGNMAASAMQAAKLYRGQQEIREQAEEARSRAMFLANAGAILASSLDIDGTLRTIGELAVPAIADWCAIDLIETEGPPRRVTVRHVNPALVEKAMQLRAKYPPREDDGFHTALRTGKTVYAAEITDQMLQKGAQSEEHLAALRELGIRSCVLAPLVVHGERLGVLTLVRSERRFSEEDVRFIEEIAQRAAFAVHSARLHHAVSQSAERLAVATAAAGLGIFEWSAEEGGVRWENQRIFDIFGRTREQGPITYEEFFSSVCHPDDQEKMLNEIGAAEAARRPILTQVRMKRQDGEWIWIEFNGQFDFDLKGEPLRLVGVVSDVTQRRKVEERLRERAKLESVGLLAGGVAHDFNNLLTGILGNASLALDFMSPADSARPMIEDVVAASERAAALTQQMLAYSGRGRFVIAPTDISKLVRDMAGLLRSSIDRAIELRLYLDPSLPGVEADCVQIQQLVMNLIINAAEAMQNRPGAVTVRTFLRDLDESAVAVLNPAFDVVPGPYVCLEVADEGCGMDEATMAKIFDPFFTTKFTGRGLGLSAVLGIVRSHKGSLQVTSEPGNGTTFRIHLPALVPVEHLASLWRGTVLVVDDEEIVRRTASGIIEAAGFRVITAENGLEAVREFHVHKGRIDLTILDLSMPVMHGEQALERILRQWPNARVVISTGFAAEETVKRFSSKRVAGFLQKPYTTGRVAELFQNLGLLQAS